MKTKQHLYTTLSAPAKTESIPENSQWLAGEGAGSWFSIEIEGRDYRINRYNSEGKIECSGLFNTLPESDFNINAPFEFVHLSHCKSVTIRQMLKVLKFHRVS
ncbi:MAG: hypothetical protein Q8S11_06685 [Daejeonella sp.]|nr:DUF6695 family protein [Daejeonella sp.]MDP3468002.1 hypothetical protein [Daejeonella sp.]